MMLWFSLCSSPNDNFLHAISCSTLPGNIEINSGLIAGLEFSFNCLLPHRKKIKNTITCFCN